jgi:hypothetical protein
MLIHFTRLTGQTSYYYKRYSLQQLSHEALTSAWIRGSIVNTSGLLGNWHGSLWLRGQPEVLIEIHAKSLVLAGVLLKLLPAFAFDMGSYVRSCCFRRYCSKYWTVSILHAAKRSYHCTMVSNCCNASGTRLCVSLCLQWSGRSSPQRFDLHRWPTQNTSFGLWFLVRLVI